MEDGRKIERVVENQWLKGIARSMMVLCPLILAGFGTVVWNVGNGMLDKFASIERSLASMDRDHRLLVVQEKSDVVGLNNRVDNISSWSNSRFDSQGREIQRNVDAIDDLKKRVYPLIRSNP